MKFRPCIDIHNGKVKQIVGGSLKDARDQAVENFVSDQDAAFFAEFYREKGIDGGHVILLNSRDSVYYEETKRQALSRAGYRQEAGSRKRMPPNFWTPAPATLSSHPMSSGTDRSPMKIWIDWSVQLEGIV